MQQVVRNQWAHSECKVFLKIQWCMGEHGHSKMRFSKIQVLCFGFQVAPEGSVCIM